MIPDSSSPLLILGCHRSGTSAITGLLHEGAGLFMGDVLPPTKENPKGYFESMPVVAAHRNILLGLGRDWTCPPTSLAPDDHAEKGLVEALAPFAEHDGPWGVKDPRLLFLLPAWLGHVPAMRFVGVIRNPGSIAKSIIKRDNLPEEFAHELVASYLERLANLHRALRFPIIDFGADPSEVLTRTRDFAITAGMEWDDKRAREFYSPSLIHHQSSQSPDTNYRYLYEAAQEPITAVETYDVAAVEAALASLGHERAESLDTTYGLRFMERRRALWRRIMDDQDLESVIELIPERAQTLQLTPVQLDHQSLVRVGPGSSVPRQIQSTVPATHVVAPGILERLDGDGLRTLLTDLDLRTRTTAVAYFDGYDGDGTEASLEEAIRDTSWTVDRVDRAATPPVLALFKNTDAMLREGSPAASERHLLSLDARLSALERAAATQREASAKRSATSGAQEVAELRKDLEKAEKALSAAQRRYDRLINRRSVKLALKASAPAGAIFRRRRARRPT